MPAGASPFGYVFFLAIKWWENVSHLMPTWFIFRQVTVNKQNSRIIRNNLTKQNSSDEDVEHSVSCILKISTLFLSSWWRDAKAFVSGWGCEIGASCSFRTRRRFLLSTAASDFTHMLLCEFDLFYYSFHVVCSVTVFKN